MTTLAEIGELGLLEHIASWVGETGIGDDAALIPTGGRDAVLSVDVLAEGVDFDLRYGTLEDVGRKAAAVNLSDIAAMGATPRALLVALSVPPTATVEQLQEFYKGLVARASEHGVAVCGGDLSTPPAGDRGWTVSVTALGVPSDHGLIRRDGAKPGDLLCVTGTLGDAALGLRLLQSGDTDSDAKRWLARRQLDPSPRCDQAAALARVAHAMIDVSDGLSMDLFHLTSASEVGAVIEMDALPSSSAFRAVAPADAETLMTSGGEDYELLFAAPNKPDLDDVTVIGRCKEEPGLEDATGRPLSPDGWEHFKGEPK